MVSKRSKTLIKNIKHLMDQAEWNQTRLAEKLGIAPGSVNNYLNGKNVPSLDSIGDIADVFGVTISDLLQSDDLPKPKVELPDAIRDAITESNAKLMKDINTKLLPVIKMMESANKVSGGLEPVVVPEPEDKIVGFINDLLRTPGLSEDFYKLIDNDVEIEKLRIEFLREVATGLLSMGGKTAKEAHQILQELVDSKGKKK